MRIPVYLYMGILEGGKTTKIKSDLMKGVFQHHKNLLIIQCEDGIVQLDEDLLEQFYAKRVFILNPKEFNRKKLSELADDGDWDGIILESHGIWPLKAVLQEIPPVWEIKSKILCADAGAFLQQYKNMDKLIAEKIFFCDELIFHGAGKEIKGRLTATVNLFNRDAVLTYV